MSVPIGEEAASQLAAEREKHKNLYDLIRRAIRQDRSNACGHSGNRQGAGETIMSQGPRMPQANCPRCGSESLQDAVLAIVPADSGWLNRCSCALCGWVGLPIEVAARPLPPALATIVRA
jgi:hypothetical protein